MLLSNESAHNGERILDFDTPKPIEAMPPYQIVTFPPYRSPPEISVQGGDTLSMRSKETPKNSADGLSSPLVIPASQDDTPKAKAADKPPITWDGGKTQTQESFEEKPRTLMKM